MIRSVGLALRQPGVSVPEEPPAPLSGRERQQPHWGLGGQSQHCIALYANYAKKSTCHRLSRHFRRVFLPTPRGRSPSRGSWDGLGGVFCQKQSSLGWGGDKARISDRVAFWGSFSGGALAPRLALESSWRAQTRVFGRHRGVSHDSFRRHRPKTLV